MAANVKNLITIAAWVAFCYGMARMVTIEYFNLVDMGIGSFFAITGGWWLYRRYYA